jgi:hypothetical protein
MIKANHAGYLPVAKSHNKNAIRIFAILFHVFQNHTPSNSDENNGDVKNRPTPKRFV